MKIGQTAVEKSPSRATVFIRLVGSLRFSSAPRHGSLFNCRVLRGQQSVSDRTVAAQHHVVDGFALAFSALGLNVPAGIVENMHGAGTAKVTAKHLLRSILRANAVFADSLQDCGGKEWISWLLHRFLPAVSGFPQAPTHANG